MSDYERIEADPEVFDEKKSKAFLKKLRRLASKIPFARTALAMFFAMRDPAVPFAAKATIAGALVYFLSPIDLIPDMMVGIGFADDAAVIATAFKAVQSVLEERHFAMAEAYLEEMRGDV